MAEYLENCRDARLKPRLLLSLLRDGLPDPDSSAAPDLRRLPRVLCLLRYHSLLSEPTGDAAWIAAVDTWVDRVLALASSSSLSRCLAGTNLLGVTCADCTKDRFIKSYSGWFQTLLSNLQPLPDSHFLRVALCASLSDLFIRLAQYPSVKKEASSLSMKIVQPLLQLLNEDSSDDVWSGALDLLHVLVDFYPSSVHRHIDKVEAVVVSKIMSAKYNEDMSKKLASCLALLPRAKGDEANFSLMFRKVLMAINTQLDDVLQGLEGGNISLDIKKMLNPPGEEIPLLGGYVFIKDSSNHTVSWLQDVVVLRLSTLTRCCALMLTNPCAVQVTIPIHILLNIVRRVLSVDGSLSESLLPSITSLYQESVCSVLVDLHSGCIDLLSAIIKGLKSQLLPHAVSIGKILKDCFAKALVPHERIKLYHVLQQLLISSGQGMALYLWQEIIKNAFTDLGASGYGINSSFGNNFELESELALHHTIRKRKHTNEAYLKNPNFTGIEVKTDDREEVASLSVQIAALGTLNALVTVGGSQKSELWRSDVHMLLMKVARNVCDAACDERNVIGKSPTVGAQFRLATLQALLACLLSPIHVRPPCLSECLEIFRKGKLGADPDVAAFCSHSLLALEVLIHPRALPLSCPLNHGGHVHDISGKNHSRDTKFQYFGGLTVPLAKHRGNDATEISIDDDGDLYNWQGDGKQMMMATEHQDKKLKTITEAGKVSMDHPDHMQTGTTRAGHSGDQEADLQTEPLVDGCRDHSRTELALVVDSEGAHETIEMITDQEVAEVEINTGSRLESNAAAILAEVVDNDAVPAGSSKLDSTNIASKNPLVFPEVAPHYDSDSSSLGSIPPIVDIEPDDDDPEPST